MCVCVHIHIYIYIYIYIYKRVSERTSHVWMCVMGALCMYSWGSEQARHNSQHTKRGGEAFQLEYLNKSSVTVTVTVTVVSSRMIGMVTRIWGALLWVGKMIGMAIRLCPQVRGMSYGHGHGHGHGHGSFQVRGMSHQESTAFKPGRKAWLRWALHP